MNKFFFGDYCTKVLVEYCTNMFVFVNVKYVYYKLFDVCESFWNLYYAFLELILCVDLVT